MTSLGDNPRRRAGLACLWLAACLGCVHAGFSLYWAAGGTWLLETIGQWAVRAAAEGGPLVTGVLAGIGVLKLVVALAPALVERFGTSGLRRPVRGLSWVAALGLTAYGGVNTLVAALVLFGVIRTDDGYDRQAMIGHALLWDPLFLAWGLSLLAALVLTRPIPGGGS